jgi:hypothetical protein
MLVFAVCGVALAETYEAPLDVRETAEASFTAKPEAVRVGDQVKVTFALSAATDVEVAVLDARGKVVRHLAAGLLGKNAPAPLQKGSLKQELIWDHKDDLSGPAGGGPFKVRVRIGAKPRLEKYLGWEGNIPSSQTRVVGIASGGEGGLFVLTAEPTGRSEMVVLDGTGRYLRTIMPYRANTPRQRTESVGQLEIAGERLPIVFNGHGQNLLPLVSGMKKQNMVFTPKGHLLLASAVGSGCNHGPPRHLLAMHPEGGAPEETGFVGPLILRPRGFMGGGGECWSEAFDHLALSPDGKWIYLTMYIDSWAFEKLRHHAVFRVRWTDKEVSEPFLGKKEPGDDDEHFNDPQGVATDSEGNVYVCDRGNGRVMVFSPEGTLVGKFPAEHPEQIAVHPRSGEIYVLSRKAGRTFEHPGTRLLKFSPWKAGEAPGELARLDMGTQVIELMAPSTAATRNATGWYR